MPTGPVIVAEQLPDDYPTKKIALDFRDAFQKVNGAPTTDAFSAYSFDGYMVFADAARARAGKGEPGTPEFRRRAARRDRQHQGSGRHARRLQLQGRQPLRRGRARARDRQARQRPVEARALSRLDGCVRRADGDCEGDAAMTWDVALILGIDGLANGAVYLLAGLGLVLIFSVTRVVFVPFGDIAAFAALTLAAFETGRMPPTIGLVAALAAAGGAGRGRRACVRRGETRAHPARRARLGRAAGACRACSPGWPRGPDVPPAVHIAAAVLLVVPIAPLVARIVVPADRRRVGAGAADRLARAALPAVGPGPAVLRARGLAHQAARRRLGRRSATACRSAAR